MNVLGLVFHEFKTLMYKINGYDSNNFIGRLILHINFVMFRPVFSQKERILPC